MRKGRPQKAKIAKKARTRVFGGAVKGAKTPAQIRAALMRDMRRKRKRR